MPPMELPAALKSIFYALLIGLLVGFQREASVGGEHHAGVRDFLLIGLMGGVCGLLGAPWLTLGALLSIAALLAVFHYQSVERKGITTDMAAIATFCLGYLTAAPGFPGGAQVAIGTTIVLVAFLEAKRALHRLIHETITEAEFSDTLWFLAIIFIIYPILPLGDFGPFHFFAPRKIWLFVILISSISYAGYFLQKFLGPERGLALTAVLGGLASTTAATASFAKSCAGDPVGLRSYVRAVVIANTVHFPRVMIVLIIVNASLAAASLWPLAAMTATGGLILLFLRESKPANAGGGSVPLGNPFRLAPALKLAAVLTAILFVVKTASALFGSRTIYLISSLGGSIDVDAIALSVSDLVSLHKLGPEPARTAVLLAIVSNAVLKTILAFSSGARALGYRLGLAFLTIFASGAAAWYVTRGWYA